MKPQTITLTHLPGILLVVLPDGSEFARIEGSFFKAERTLNDYSTSLVRLELPQGNCRIVSTLADLTENQARGLVEKGSDSQGNESGYADYDAMFHGVNTALESFHSAIRASGWYLENPHGEEPKPDNTPNYAYSVYVRIWESAQSRVLSRERTLILRRVR